MRRSARFYAEVVALEPEVAADDEWAWFQVGRDARLGLHQGALLFEEHSPRSAGDRFGAVHYALRVPRERLEAAVAHVRAAGVEVYGPTSFAWMRSTSYYFFDPDGNLLEWWSPDPQWQNRVRGADPDRLKGPGDEGSTNSDSSKAWANAHFAKDQHDEPRAERSMDELIETWRIADAATRRLLAAIPDEHFATKLAKGKSVAGGFAHAHNVRLMWVKASGPDLLEGQMKLETESAREEIDARLRESAAAIAEILRRAGTPGGTVKGFKPHAAAFVGYLASHEAFHRAQIELALRQASVPISEKDAYALWEWGTLAKGIADEESRG